MSTIVRTETTSAYTVNQQFDRFRRSYLCLRAKAERNLLCIGLVAVAVGPESVNLDLPIEKRLASPRESRVRLFAGSGNQIGVRLGEQLTDSTPQIIYRAAAVLFKHFGGALEVTDMIQEEWPHKPGNVRICEVPRYSHCSVTVPSLDPSMERTGLELTFPQILSTTIGATGLSALLNLQQLYPDAVAGTTRIALDCPPAIIETR